MVGDGSATPVLEVRGLSVRYGPALTVLRGVDLEVPAGAIVALLGPNGAGKTTLLRALTGLLPFHHGRVTGGEVLLEGDPVRRTSASALVRRGMAQVMEGRRIFAELTVEENLRAGAVTVRDRRRVVAVMGETFEMFPQLAGRRGDQAGYLSGGEQQMLAIGRALMSSPKLLLLDEPSLGLAPRITEQIAERIRVVGAAGTTVLLVEQNAAMALAIAETAYVLQAGQVAMSGPAAVLRDDSDVQRLYLGDG
ncbi:MAG: ABC transporter ATP-binding protein [Acidimicrobiia bacterium]|nr:ABC transporter ATP-binding protein [Acidimicrobiia bacterium]